MFLYHTDVSITFSSTALFLQLFSSETNSFALKWRIIWKADRAFKQKSLNGTYHCTIITSFMNKHDIWYLYMYILTHHQVTCANTAISLAAVRVVNLTRTNSVFWYSQISEAPFKDFWHHPSSIELCRKCNIISPFEIAYEWKPVGAPTFFPKPLQHKPHPAENVFGYG